MKEKYLNIIKLIISFLLFFFLSTIIRLILKRFGIDTSMFDYQDYGYFETLLELIFAVIILLFYRKIFTKDLLNFKNSFKGFMNEVFRLFAIFLAIKIASALLTNFIGMMIGIDIGESENQSTIIKITKEAPIMMLISTSILAPIVEEGIFRLGLRKVVNNNYLFIILSGLIFGLMHIFPTDLLMVEALVYSITYVTMGIYLAYIYVETDNIWINILVHGINNLISMIAILALY